MAIRFTATLNAFARGIEDSKPSAAVALIEDWESALSDLDIPGAKSIARDLASLRRQLEADEPDAERVEALLHRLGQATTKIAERAPSNGDKLRQLGEALEQAGTEEQDEDEDKEAMANPRSHKAGTRAGRARQDA
jgi:small-conductance mechanosensitive channel